MILFSWDVSDRQADEPLPLFALVEPAAAAFLYALEISDDYSKLSNLAQGVRLKDLLDCLRLAMQSNRGSVPEEFRAIVQEFEVLSSAA